MCGGRPAVRACAFSRSGLRSGPFEISRTPPVTFRLSVGREFWVAGWEGFGFLVWCKLGGGVTSSV